MDNSLDAILDGIASGKLLPAPYFQSLDCSRVLDSRDQDEVFDSEWARLFAELQHRWSAAKIAEGPRKLVEDIRRESFMAVSRATKQNEIASYVSDDFDLIIRGKLVGMDDNFLGQLWATYERGEVPCPPLQE
jgi:hypothetical protein